MWPNPVTFTEQIFDGKLHFLCSEYDKKKKQIKHEDIQKVCHLHNGNFHPILNYLSHFFNITLTFPLCYSLNFTKKL